MTCHNCGAGPLLLAPGYERLRRVSSDCQPRPPGGRMGVCPVCGLAQALTDENWQQEAKNIYGDYRIYHQSSGAEQPVFDPGTGKGRARSEILVEQLVQAARLPRTGRLLDIGCGNGGFLRACSKALPDWKLSGSEFDQRHRTAVESIPGVEKLHCGALEAIPGKFDVISLIHVLEHIPAPTEFLKSVAAKLTPQGWLFIEVPDCSTNPFMLLVADHSSHFTPSSLSAVVSSAGFELVRVGPPWVIKEISLLAHLPQRTFESQLVAANWEFLRNVSAEVSLLASRGPYGIFGTSIGATWLNAQTDRTAAFFVDEDPQRAGRQHDQRPIFDIASIPARAIVYIALPPALAEPIAQRVRNLRPDVSFLTPGTNAIGKNTLSSTS